MRARMMIACLWVGACGGRDDARPRASKDATTSPVIDAGDWLPSSARTVKATQVAVGDGASCAIVTGGRVRCWGRNDHGEHGKGASATQAATPVEIPGVVGATEVAIADRWTGALGRVCARAEGKVWCWGGDPGGAFPADHGPRDVLDGAAHLAFGDNELVVMADGTVQTWGDNMANALGVGADVRDAFGQPVPGITDAVAATSSHAHGCAIRRDGTVRCWGYFDLEMAPTAVPGVAGATAIASPRYSQTTCAVVADGAVRCWGSSLRPLPVAGLDQVISLSADGRFCAVRRDGTVWCWNDTDPPVAVDGLTGVAQIAVGMDAACATRRDGTVACWGSNRHGQLGDGTLIDRASPVEVDALDHDRLPPPVDGTAAVASLSPQAWDDLPAACARGPFEGTFKAVRGPIPQASGYAYTLRGGSDTVFYLANTPLPSEAIALTNVAPRGHELVIRLTLLLGDRVPQEHSATAVRASVSDRAPDAASLTETWVKVTHVDDAWICGELRLATAATQQPEARLAGPFAARRIAVEWPLVLPRGSRTIAGMRERLTEPI